MEQLPRHAPKSSCNKTTKSARGIILKSQLLQRAKTIWNKMALNTEDDMSKIMEDLYNCDALSICITDFSEFSEMIKSRRSTNESFASFEACIMTSETKLNSKGNAVSILESLTAWLLIQNAFLNPSQNLWVMYAAASTDPNSDLTRSSGKNAFLKCIKYEHVASVIRQYDNILSKTAAEDKSH